MAFSNDPKVHLDELETSLNTIFLNIGSVFEDGYKAHEQRRERQEQRAAALERASSPVEERDCKLRNENEEQREIDRHSERVAKTAARIEERVPGVLEKWRAALDALESEIIQARAIMKRDVLEKRHQNDPVPVLETTEMNLGDSSGIDLDMPDLSVLDDTSDKPSLSADTTSEAAKRTTIPAASIKSEATDIAKPSQKGDQADSPSQNTGISKEETPAKFSLSTTGGDDPKAAEPSAHDVISTKEVAQQGNNSQQDLEVTRPTESNQQSQQQAVEAQRDSGSTAAPSTAASQDASQTTTAKDSTANTQDDTLDTLIPGIELYANNNENGGQGNSQSNESGDNPLSLGNENPDSFTLDNNDAANDLFGDMNLNMDMSFSKEGDFGDTTGHDSNLDDLFSFDQIGENAFSEGLTAVEGGDGNQGQQNQNGFDLFDEEFFNL